MFEGVLDLVFDLVPSHGVFHIQLLATSFHFSDLKVILQEVSLDDGWQCHEDISLIHGVVFDLLFEENKNLDVLGLSSCDGERVSYAEFRSFSEVAIKIA